MMTLQLEADILTLFVKIYNPPMTLIALKFITIPKVNSYATCHQKE